MADLVALDIPAGTAFVEALQRVWDAGDAAAPLDPRLSGAAAAAHLAALRPTRVVDSDGETHALPGGVAVEEGDAVVVATSGSTGAPRGVVLTHGALAASALATSRRLGVDPARHTWLACLPLAHIGGLAVVTRALVTGTPLVALAGFDATEVRRLGASGAVTHTALVATALRRIDPAAFATILLGGAAPPGGLPPNVVTTYGMTETGSGIVYDGVPLEGVEVALVGVDGAGAGGAGAGGPGAGGPGGGTTAERGAAGESGQILLRGPMLLRAYRDGTDPRVTGPGGRMWLATGDGGRIGTDGHLEVFGRLAEVIVTGGEKVWPSPVERVLSIHPAVAEIAVWKRPDPQWGERVVAWVVPADPGNPPALGDLRDTVAAELPRWWAPKELVLTPSLPRTPSGKVRRQDLV